MWNPLWLLAVLATTFFVEILAGSSASSHSSSSSYSSSSHSSSSVSSSSSSTSYSHAHGGCGNEPSTSSNKCPKPNEVLDPCLNPCPPRYCGVNIAAILCAVPETCEPGCRCADGYLRNGKGICIPADKCPKCPKPNEVYDVCPAPCPPRRCDVDDRVIRCAAPPNPGDPECEPGCRCADGYVRNDDGVCVTRDQCTPKCGDHEEHVQCPPAVCRPKECSDVGMPIPCPDLSSQGCPEDPACICEDGYAKNKDGDCVPWNQCPSCGGDPNAVSGCGTNCNRHCSDRNKPPGACAAVCLYNGCDCKEGFLFDDNTGQCVRPEKCTPTCKKDEVYSDCIDICQPQNCSQLGFLIVCPASVDHCVAGCKCKDGYMRADNGTCIPVEQCPSCGGDPHAVAGCGVNCNKHCSDLHGSPKPCPKICKVNACDCKDGYYFDDHTSQCVLPKQCTPECKKKHEAHSNCVNGDCSPLKCSELGFPKTCPDLDESQCVGGCVCDAGYVYDDLGNCIPKSNCSSCGGDPNAVSGCGLNCGRHCSNYDKGPVPCPRICFPNACDCKKEFVFDDNIKKCVLPKHCTPVCKENEVYSDCINGGCQAKNCSQLGTPIPCIKMDPKYCIKGCLCIEGYLRAENGTCVPESQCDQCKNPHEVWDPCPPICPPQTCESIGKKYFCPRQKNCTGACRCEKGYYRNKLGECISEKDCLKCQGEHEYFSCGGACDNVCVNLHEQNQTNCPIVNIVCNPMCYCEEGYARDNNKTCVPFDKCPTSCGGDPNAVSGCGLNCGRHCSNYDKGPVPCPRICFPNACDCKKEFVFDDNIKKCVLPKHCTPVCKENEVYSDCINGGCQAKNCSQLGTPIPCIKMDPKYCIKGCLCIEGYLRAENGTCVPESQCDQCKNPHEVWDPCPPICPPQTCESIGKKYFCPRQKNCTGACRCEKGYYRNKLGECISEKDCLKCQGEHEYFSCGGACDNVCVNLHEQNQTNCPIVNIVCNPMCYCEEGYARDNNKTCVPFDKCPKPQCKANERYEACPATLCTPQNCSQVGFPIPCNYTSDPTHCPGPPGCVCIDGYVRDCDGICIPIENCPSCGGDKNAVSGCGINCGRLCSNYDSKEPIACPLVCKVNSCDCRKEFVFDENTKKCVRPRDCMICEKPHEIYDPCPSSCPITKCESIDNASTRPLQPGIHECKGACLCDHGYYRNKIGECHTESDCRQCEGPNEYFSCGGACDNVCLTLSKQNQTNCPIINKKCNPMCYCDKDYARDDNRICIPINQCGAPICKPNEVYSSCANGGCRRRKCSDLGGPILCIDPIQCEGGCICREGYVLAEDGTCIPEEKCPNQCKRPHEVYNRCPSDCPPQTCESLDRAYVCPIKECICHCPVGQCNCNCCKGGCVCEDGYYRNSAGECISEEDCRRCTGENEFYSCRAPCDNVCTTLYIQNQTYCPYGTTKCKCFCEEGYARNKSGNCIYIDDCPEPRCGPNERYEEDPESVSEPFYCSELGFPISVPRNNTTYCGAIAHCICKQDFVRGVLGICIPKTKCGYEDQQEAIRK